MAPLSVFLEFNLPNATTWFYFSFLLAVALFFKFGRLLSVRNWDVVTLFLLVPGLLLIHGARPAAVVGPQHPAVQVAGLLGQMAPGGNLAGSAGAFAQRFGPTLEAGRWLWVGYLWLLVGSAYLFCRCLADLALVQRPALSPNLSFGGLAWFAGALLVCLAAVAFRQAEPPSPPSTTTVARPTDGPPAANGPVGRETASVALFRRWADFPWWADAAAAVGCHLVVVLGLIAVGRWHFGDAQAGMAAATFYLLLPYTGLYVGQLHHVAPVALLVWTVALYRRPTLAGALLGVAAALTYVPALTLPIWLSFYRGRGMARFLVAFLLLLAAGLGGLGYLLDQAGDLEPLWRDTLAQTAWQPWKVPHTEGFWTGVPWAYRIPVFLAYLAFLSATMFWPAPKTLAHVLALSAAVLVGLQFWYADQGGVYVLWYLPLLLLLVFRPNLQDRQAPPIPPETDWLHRARRGLWRFLRWVVRMPEPTQARSF